ncbi:MAG: hypothetical protein OSJ36_05765 [Odoribacter sp.]|nr:hypothetical protein [Odoribacter sp.]
MKIFYLSDKNVYEPKEIPEKEIAPKALPSGKLGGYFRHHFLLEVEEKVFMLKDMIALAKVFNTEFAAYTQDGKLYIKKGEAPDLDAGIAGYVKIPATATMLVHVHPAFKSYRAHLSMDLAVPTPDTEAIVDYEFTIIAYRNGEVFNAKNPDGSYISLSAGDPHWPPFLSHTSNYNVEVDIR